MSPVSPTKLRPCLFIVLCETITSKCNLLKYSLILIVSLRLHADHLVVHLCCRPTCVYPQYHLQNKSTPDLVHIKIFLLFLSYQPNTNFIQENHKPWQLPRINWTAQMFTWNNQVSWETVLQRKAVPPIGRGPCCHRGPKFNCHRDPKFSPVTT